MINFEHEITGAKLLAIKAFSEYVGDELPPMPEKPDFTGAGFRAVPPLIRSIDSRPVMAHNEAGYFISKMCAAPERNYDAYIDRLITVKSAEEQSGKSRFIAVEDFSVSAMVRLYALFRGRINVSEETWARLKKSLIDTVFAPYFEPMSENHKLCFLSSELVAANLFPDDVFYDGMDGKTRMILVKRAVKAFLQKRLRRGWSEYDSSSYYEIDFMSLLNLYDFSPDSEIKRLASDCMNVMAAGMFVHAVNGYPAGPKGRVYPNVVENPKNGVYSIVRLAGASGEFTADSVQITGMMYMATSDFMLDKEVYDIVMGNTGKEYEVKDSVGLYTIPDDMYVKGKIYKYFYKGTNYCMGCVAGRDDPYENVAHTWLCGHQEQAWSLTFADNPKAVVYSSHPGNPQMFDYGMHGEWTGDCNCLCQHFVQNKNLLLCYWNITDKRQLQYIHLYIPEEEFDSVEYQKNSIIAAMGCIDVRISLPSGYERIRTGAYKKREVRINAARGCFAVEVSSAAKQSSDLPQLLENGALYRGLKIENDITYIDDKPFDREEYKLYNSPYLKSEYDSGAIELTYNGSRRIYGI